MVNAVFLPKLLIGKKQDPFGPLEGQWSTIEHCWRCRQCHHVCRKRLLRLAAELI